MDEIDKLPGVGAATAEKLGASGYDNFMSIAVSSPGEMVNVAGVTEATARKIIAAARDSLDMGFETGEELLKKREQVIKLTTGCKAFDDMLAGGFETGSISECFGEFGCVSSDTLITLADGKMIEIGKIAGSRGAGEYEIELPIVTWFNNSLSKTFSRKLFVYDCDNLMKVTLSDGRIVQVTPNHPLMTQNGWKRADALSKEDYLVVSWPNFFPKDNVKLTKEITIHEKAPKTTLKKINFPEKLDEDLAGILGYLLGEGWHERFSKDGGIARVSIGSSNKKIIGDWKKLVKSVFGIDSVFRRIESITETWSINSVMVGEFLKQFLGIYLIAKEKYVPEQIFRSPKHVVAKFLACLYDSEGYAKQESGKGFKKAKWVTKDGKVKQKTYFNEKKGKSIEFRSSSIKLIQQVQLLLTKFEIKSSITQDMTRGFIGYKLHIYRKENLVKFYNHIGCKTYRLKTKISDIIESYQRVLQLPNINLVKIRGIEIVNNLDGKVYDIEVPQTHSFLANNIVSHNSSKSQIAHVLAVRTQLPRDQGGADGSVIFIDGESTFRPERIIQIAKGASLDPEETLKNINVARAFNSDHQMLLAERVEDIIKEKMESERPIRLIVVDSLTAHFRADFSGRGELAPRQQKLNRHMHVLMRVASQYNICVYVTNQVMAKPDMFFGDPTAAIGGNIVGHNCLLEGTLIQLPDGRIRRIEELFNEEKVLGVNLKNDLKTKKTNIQTISMKQKNKIYHLQTTHRISSSSEHRFFTFDNFQVKEVRAEDLKKGQYVAHGFDFEIEGEMQKLPDVEQPRLVTISPEGSKLIVDALGGTRKEICENLEVTPRQFRRILNQNYPTNKINIDLLIKIGVSEDIKSHISDCFTNKHKNIDIPKTLDKKLAQVLGYFLGDGYLDKRSVTFKDERFGILEFYRNLFFDLTKIEGAIKEVPNKNCYELQINSKIIRDLFEKIKENLFDYVGKSPDFCIRAFLKGFFDADGSIDGKTGYVSASQKDDETIMKIQLLLDRIGVRSKIRKYLHLGNWINQLDIRDNLSIRKFSKVVGFTAEDKKLKLKEKLDNFRFSQEMTPIKREELKELIRGFDIYPSKILRPRDESYEFVGLEELKKVVDCLMNKKPKNKDVRDKLNFLVTFLNSDLRWEKISKIEIEHTKRNLYDFGAENLQNYIANGFLVHNSQVRIYLRKGKKGTRVAKLVDSPYLKDSESIYNVTEKGIEDV
jgi:DNA repair protein RadA